MPEFLWGKAEQVESNSTHYNSGWVQGETGLKMSVKREEMGVRSL
jgi:hypothetical protein